MRGAACCPPWLAAPIAAPVTADDLSACSRSTGGREAGGFDTGVEKGLRRDPRRSPSSCIAWSPAARRVASSPGRTGHRRRARVTPAFFLWSEMPDEALIARARGEAARDPAGTGAGRAHARRPDARASLIDNFAFQWLGVRRSDATSRSAATSRTSIRCCARRSATEMRAVPRQHLCSEDPQRPRPAQRRLHVRERAAGAPLRHPDVRQQFRRVALTDPARRGSAWPGQRAHGLVVPGPHLAGAARR